MPRMKWGLIAALALFAAAVGLTLLLRGPADVRGEITGADVEMITKGALPPFVVALRGIGSLRLPVYEVDVDGLQGASIQYQESGASKWSTIPGAVRWLNIVPKPEVTDAQPGVLILSPSSADSPQQLHLTPGGGRVETVKFASGKPGSTETFLALSGEGLSLSGKVNFASATSPAGNLQLLVTPTTGYISLQYTNTKTNEPRNLSQITAMRISGIRSDFHLDLRPSLLSQWNFGFGRQPDVEAWSWTLESTGPVQVARIMCKRVSSGRLQIGYGDPQELIRPSDLDFQGGSMQIQDSVRVSAAGVTVTLDGNAAHATANGRNVGRWAMFTSVYGLFLATAGAASLLLSILLAIKEIRQNDANAQ